MERVGPTIEDRKDADGTGPLTAEEWSSSYNDMTDDEKELFECIRAGTSFRGSAVAFSISPKSMPEGDIKPEREPVNVDWDGIEDLLKAGDFSDENIGSIFTAPFKEVYNIRRNIQLMIEMNEMALENPAIIPTYVSDFKECRTPKEGVGEIMRQMEILRQKSAVQAGRLKAVTSVMNLRFNLQIAPQDWLTQDQIEEYSKLPDLTRENEKAREMLSKNHNILLKNETEWSMYREEMVREIFGDESGIETNQIRSMNELKGGLNEAYSVDIVNFGQAIMKPKRGESVGAEATDIPVGTFHLRERAAYVVDRFLDLGIVPTTVIRDIEYIGPASVQQYVSGRPVSKFLDLNKDKYDRHPEGFSDLLLFDYSIWNCDRHSENVRVGEKVWAIDNGLSFNDSMDHWREGSAKHFHTGFDGRESMKISDQTREKYKQLVSDPDKLKLLEEFLSELVKPDEARCCINRIKALSKALSSGQKLNSSDFYSYSYSGG